MKVEESKRGRTAIVQEFVLIKWSYCGYLNPQGTLNAARAAEDSESGSTVLKRPPSFIA